ncbi:uncharacterized protein UBRO_20428 [Ustilago bromivora]|uniref:Reverse transcriptase RNase H-like domain-containing protein n=1 Tax=Ustilago bromivora TaxID=307758 RepID=A0A1K0H586_9BASI|nr:uncharacterized protein UBRO_20428 [Ustilago bromivora]
MSPVDLKLLGLELKISCLVWAIHHFQHFLDSTVKIMVVTDHAPLSTALQSHSPSMRQFTPHIEQLRAYLMPLLDSMECHKICAEDPGHAWMRNLSIKVKTVILWSYDCFQ